MKQFIPEEHHSRTLSNIIVVCVGIALTAFIIYFNSIWSGFMKLVDAAMPIIVGFGIAFLLLPIVSRMERFFNRVLFRHKPHPRVSRAVATTLGYIVLLALLAGFFAILVPQLVNSIKSVVQYIAAFINTHTDEINDLLLKYNFLSLEGEQFVIAWDNIVSQLMNYSSVAIDYLMTISGGIYNVLFQFVMGLIAGFYMLLDKERFCSQIKKLCYATFKRPVCEKLIYWTRRANTIFAGFISGKILDSLIIGIICYVAMLLMRLEYPLLISVIVGITNVIPFFGPYIGAVPSILILLLVHPVSALWFTIFIIILQQLDGNVIGPFILGDYVGLPAFWIMVSILVGGSLFGFAGMLLSVPVFALIYAIVRTVAETRLKERKLPTDSKSYETAPETLKEEEA